jgi:hypothetical protein
MKLSPIQTQLEIEMTVLARANHINSHIKKAGEESETPILSSRKPPALTRPAAPFHLPYFAADIPPESSAN